MPLQWKVTGGLRYSDEPGLTEGLCLKFSSYLAGACILLRKIVTAMKTKTALVTGAASGFGFEFAKLLASDRYALILADKDEARLAMVKEQLQDQFNVPAGTIVSDLSKPQAASEIYAETKDMAIEILINNAGYGLFGFFTQTDWEKEEKMIGLHVTTTTHLTKLFVSDMVKRGNGKIMNVSSMAAFQPGPLMAVYYATKTYLLSFTEALANEVKGTGVTVTAFCPGQTKTGFQDNVARASNAHRSKSAWIADPAKVARVGYLAMQSGKPLSVPGVGNKSIVLLNRFLPRRVVISLVRILQENIRK